MKKKANVHNLLLWLAALAFLTIYFVFYLYGYLNRSRVATGEVMPGSAEDTYIFSALCVREETVYFAETSGAVAPVKQSGERVRKGGAVCAITDAAELAAVEEELTRVDEAILKSSDTSKSPFAADIKQLDEKMRAEVINAASGAAEKFESVYQLKDRLTQSLDSRRQILSFGAQTNSKQLARDRSIYETRLENAKKVIYADEGGLVSYTIDGAEGVYTPERVLSAGADIARFNPPKAVYAQNVSVSQPACRVVTSNTWYIAAFCAEEKAAAGWRVGTYAAFSAESETGRPVELNATVKEITQRDGGVYALFELDTELDTFLDSRVISLTVTKNRADGLKIPVQSIVKKTLLSIPKAFTYEKDAKTYVRKYDAGAVTAKNSGVTETVITFTDKSEDGETYYIIQDYNNVKFMDTLVNEGGQTYIIAETNIIEGVFIANTGAPAFRPITRQEGELGKDFGGYVVLAQSQNPKVKPHDRIVLDASRLDDSSLVY